MARVTISEELYKEIDKIFPLREAKTVVRLIMSLEEQPKKGKIVGVVNEGIVKKLKHGKYRLYCVTDGFTLRFGTEEELAHLLIKFVRMSNKKEQQKTIDEIKKILQTLGF